jgi:hypothetical protein
VEKIEEIRAALEVYVGDDNTKCKGNCDGCPADRFRKLHINEACDDGTMRAALEAINSFQARFTAPIVCMCGSTKFKQAWIAENARLTQEGNIVLAVGLWGHHERKYPSPDVKAKLDDLHKRKIDLCDWVWVLDVNGYIGESTRSEIAYAEALGRPVRYLSREFLGYVEPIDELAQQLAESQRREKAAREALRDMVAQHYTNSAEIDQQTEWLIGMYKRGTMEENK